MKYRSRHRPNPIEHWTTSLWVQIGTVLIVAALIVMAYDAWADDAAWEFKVVILQGVTAGGTLERNAEGIYVDTRRTRALNTLAADGWEVVAMTGAVATDHTVYLRRRTNR